MNGKSETRRTERMRKILFWILLWISMIPPFHGVSNAAENIAKGKSYTVSPAPNYPLSAPPTDTVSLTDGKYTVGYFWTRPSTVGWQNTKNVEILIDLGKTSIIGSIVFSTARGEGAGVHYPSHIAAFVGPDPEHLQFAGDLADDPENRSGPYQLKQFGKDGIGARGRYVLMIVVSKGYYLFCDEIELIEGGGEKGSSGYFDARKAREFTDRISRLRIEKELLGNLADDLRKTRSDPGLDGRLQDIKRQIASVKSLKETEAVESELFALRGADLRPLYPDTALQVGSIDPWAPMNPMSKPAGLSSPLDFTLPRGGYGSRAVNVSNVSAKPCDVSLSVEPVPAGVSVDLFHVPFVKSAAIEYVADPLVPVRGPITLRPGKSSMIFITAFGKQAGSWKSELRITVGGNVRSVPITIRVAGVEMPMVPSLNSVNFAYLDFKLIRDRQQAAVADLLAHHTNVVVVSPKVLPLDLDLGRLEPYLRSHRGFGKVVLFMSLKSDYRLTLGGRYPFLGEQWKAAMKKWYEGARDAAVRVGFQADQVYWFPFDEMDGQEIDQFIALARWAREKIPGVKFYSTLDRKTAERALSYLDVAQIINDDRVLGSFPSGKTEKWLYDTKSPAKSQSPYSYYRLMAWKAFLKGYTGIGFWSYSDDAPGDDPVSAWDDFGGKYPGYAVIYEGEGGAILSSRRWEAWRMGIEDYELLRMYAQAKGDATAKASAKSVLENPEDTTKADEVRRKILLELSK